MSEFELIARLIPSLPANSNVVAGAGDDCAVLDFGLPEKLFLFRILKSAKGSTRNLFVTSFCKVQPCST